MAFQYFLSLVTALNSSSRREGTKCSQIGSDTRRWTCSLTKSTSCVVYSVVKPGYYSNTEHVHYQTVEGMDQKYHEHRSLTHTHFLILNYEVTQWNDIINTHYDITSISNRHNSIRQRKKTGKASERWWNASHSGTLSLHFSFTMSTIDMR